MRNLRSGFNYPVIEHTQSFATCVKNAIFAHLIKKYKNDIAYVPTV